MNSNDLNLGISLLKLMRYKKGPKNGKIFSKHLQKKACDFIEKTMYHSNKSSIICKKSFRRKNQILQKANRSLHGKIGKYKQMYKRKISQIRSVAHKKPIITNKQLKLAIESRLMANKKQYSTET